MNINPAIVVVAYNRPQALKGLLASLLRAEYQGNDIPLVISIDGGGISEVVAIAEAFEWPFGKKIIRKQSSQLGLKQHILACVKLTKEHDNIILLEDDLEVAEGYYQFAIDALAVYGNDEAIAGISLYSYATTESDFSDFKAPSNGLDSYLMQFPSSWGQAWTVGQWLGFEVWLGNNPNPDFGKLPNYIQRWGNQSWKKLFALYLIETGKFFVYPKSSFTTNKGYAGTHFAQQLTLFDVPLHSGPNLTLTPLDTLKKYDANFRLFDAPKVSLHQKKKTVEAAEFERLVKSGKINDSVIERWKFIGKYKFYNYLKAAGRWFK